MRRHHRRSRKRAIEKMEDESTFNPESESRLQTYPGSCALRKCKGETACLNRENNTYTCVCTHTSLPPTPNGDCPRRIVTQDKIIQQKIPVQPPPKDPQIGPAKAPQNVTSLGSDRSLASTQTTHNVANFAIPAACVVGTVLLAVTIYYFRIKAKRRNDAASPINLKHSLLIPDRYAPNPQYSACCSTDVPVIRKETLKFLSELGEGCFGKVYKGELLRGLEPKSDVVAIKVLKESATKEAEEDFFREVEIMSTFQHPNILSFVGVVLREGTTCGTINPMMVFEYMEHGDLAEVLRAQHRSASSDSGGSPAPTLRAADLLSVALQISCGMEYLAAQRFVHRDLACRNCLVAEGPTVKIADFGMSRDVYTCDYYKIGGSRLLPVRWMSPESVVYGRFTLESDIWSYGVVLWEIYSFGKQPYYGHSNEEVVKLVLDGIMLIPPEDSPLLICDLMRNCWKTEPKHRITFPRIKAILQEAYFSRTMEAKEAMFKNDQSDEVDGPPPASLGITNELKTAPPTSSDIATTIFARKTPDPKPKTLPRPPPLPKTISRTDLLDSQGYMVPDEIREPVQYLKTLPD